MENENEKQPTSRWKKGRIQWVKCTLWSVIFLLFIYWHGNYWWLLLLPFIFDMFIPQYIPWTWWKKSKNKLVRTVMSWVDAIVFALIAVYLIHTYIFQNYQIPTSSLEKTLLVGDYLFVSKADFGPRVPITPLSFPLVQHTLPMLNIPSFSIKPTWKYRRLKGLDKIERNDIVVFNFPTGDTVVVKQSNPDYYTLCYNYGKDVVNTRTDIFGEKVFRPVDRRENYVKRCVAMPGDWLRIKNNQVYVNGNPQEEIKGLQFNYFVQTDGTRLTSHTLDNLNISKDDQSLLNNMDSQDLIGYLKLNANYPIYHFPLTAEAYGKLKRMSSITKIVIEPDFTENQVFPLGGGKKWSRDNYGPIWIPQKGTTLILNAYNYPIYERAIRVYERNDLQQKEGKFYINGKETDRYTFKMDYFWMMGDNRHNSADSRSWGFVPEDHVVGRPLFVWLSLDKDKPWFGGKIRWDRFFKNATK